VFKGCWDAFSESSADTLFVMQCICTSRKGTGGTHVNVRVKGLVVLLLDPIAYWDDGEILISNECFTR
jgi:hypothetical protein